MTTVSVDEAQHDLPSLVARVEQGETIVLERDGKAVGQLGPIATVNRSMAGQFTVPDDFNEMMRAEIEEMFCGDSDLDIPLNTKDASYRLGMLEGQAHIPENWKEIGRQEIEEDFYGKG
jgi:antitoxin (DNA-binding transcriptional repressor) of toxin-antitoxin stability system